MGFDLIGNSGNYFRATNWSWWPIVKILSDSGKFTDNTLEKMSANDWRKVSKYSALKMARVVNDFLESHPKDKAPLHYHQSGRDKFRLDKDSIVRKSGDPGFEYGESAWSSDRKLAKEFLKFLRYSDGFLVT